jgi:hypothetical protein
MKKVFLVTIVAGLAATTAGQTIDVLDFRPAAIQSALNGSSGAATQAPQLNLLAKLGTKTQGQRSSNY